MKYRCSAQYVDTCISDYLQSSYSDEGEVLLLATPAGQDSHEMAGEMVGSMFEPDVPDEIEDSAIIEAIAKALEGVDLRAIDSNGNRVDELPEEDEGSDAYVYVVFRWEHDESD